MQQNTPLHYFQGTIGENILRLNLITNKSNETSNHAQGLGIYIENKKEGVFFEDMYTSQNLPKQAATIFFDFPTLFDYIIENHRDEKRVRIIQEGLLVCNIIKARGTQRRQEALLPMTSKPLMKTSSIQQNQSLAQLRQKMQDLTTTTQQLSKKNQQLKEEIRQIRKIVVTQSEAIKEGQRANEQMIKLLKGQIEALKGEVSSLKGSSKLQMNTLKEEHKHHLNTIKSLKQQLEQQKDQSYKLKQYLKTVISPNHKIQEGLIPPLFHTHLLGQKVDLTIDKDNQFINMFSISANKLIRAKDDLKRYQLLGNQIMGKVSNTYYEVTINKLSNGNLLIGLVSLSRKGQRHSHDHPECVCLEASGKIFQMGKKYPSIFKLQAGQTVRVHLDLDSSRVRWLIGFTEVGSVVLPDYLMHSKLVAYIELNEVGDQITLNQ